MKKITSILLALLLCFTLCGCGETYEDTNGNNNFKLQTITDQDIIHLKTGSSNLTYKETNIGGIKSSEYKSKNFNGVEQLYLTDYIMKSDVCIYIGHMSVNSGNFRLVVINNDEIIKDIPLDVFGEEFWFYDIKGPFSIHVAGESANFTFHMEVY